MKRNNINIEKMLNTITRHNQYVLGIRGGSGYQAAILSVLFDQDTLFGQIKPQAIRAQAVLIKNKCNNVDMQFTNGAEVRVCLAMRLW